MKKIICYIVYGDEQDYYDSAKFSILTLLNYTKNTDIEIAVLTTDIDQFKQYPVNVLSISKSQEKAWSLNHQYHFRIKNLGLQSLIKGLKLSANDKILFFDADIYFNKNPLNLFNLINNNQAVMYKNEGSIYRKKRFHYYRDSLKNRTLSGYTLGRNSYMWGSAIIGIQASSLPLVQAADHLMLSFIKILDMEKSHTIEQLSLTESLRTRFRLVEGKYYVNIFSTSKRKRYALPLIKKLLANKKRLHIDQLSKQSLTLDLNRPILRNLKDKLYG